MEKVDLKDIAPPDKIAIFGCNNCFHFNQAYIGCSLTTVVDFINLYDVSICPKASRKISKTLAQYYYLKAHNILRLFNRVGKQYYYIPTFTPCMRE